MNKKIKMSLAIVMAGILTYGNVYFANVAKSQRKTIEYQQQLIDAQEKYMKAQFYKCNAAIMLIASPAFNDKAVREKLYEDMKQECLKYKQEK